ncbi:Uncharacterised protein [Mycobacteroides abscessus]|nr:Uncharacterised protein [Mycobacteroides abscessus]
MNSGLANASHHPDRRISRGGRNDVTRSPNVGIVHRTASTIAMIDAGREETLRRTLSARASRPATTPLPLPSSTVSSTSGASGTEADSGVLIGSPPPASAAARCTR